jgi:hypothetical protein
MKKETHKHYWWQPHIVYEGRNKNEVGVVRFCDCGVRQMAFTDNWRKPPKNYDVAKMTLKELREL